MQEYFTIYDGTIARLRKHKNGFTILVKEPPINNLSKPKFNWVGIWDQNAEKIAPKLEVGARFRFGGNITERNKNGKIYRNRNVMSWKVLPPKEKPKYTPLPEPDDDWYVPEMRNRDSRSARLAEGFSN